MVLYSLKILFFYKKIADAIKLLGIKNWFSNVDFTIVGSGIVGLHAALNLRERFPK
jgi:hypothetical protein